MAKKDDVIEMEGVVQDVLPNTQFIVHQKMVIKLKPTFLVKSA